MPLLTTFCLLAAMTLGLALTRLLIVRTKPDDSLHLADSDVLLIEKQRTAARRLRLVDLCGKTLTVLTLVFGIAAYSVWWIGS